MGRLKEISRAALPIVRRTIGPQNTARLIRAAAKLNLASQSGRESLGHPSPQLSKEVSELAANYASKRIGLFLLSPRMLSLQDRRIAEAIAQFFAQTNSLPSIGATQIAASVAEFRKVFLDSPVTGNVYGANFPSGVNLFCLARHLKPSLIVESGVYKGQSSYFLASACPTARVLAFDPNLSEVKHRAAGVVYNEHDWINTDVRCNAPDTGLCFFDDHQNQALRVIQAYERGFRHILFDDSWPIDVITGTGWPPLPSLDMVMNDTLEPDETVEWIEGDKKWRYSNDEKMRDLCTRARRLIKFACDVPTLYRECGIAPTSAYKYVELISDGLASS